MLLFLRQIKKEKIRDKQTTHVTWVQYTVTCTLCVTQSAVVVIIFGLYFCLFLWLREKGEGIPLFLVGGLEIW